MLYLRPLFIHTIIILLVSLSELCCGYRILGIFPFNGRSHMMMLEQMMKGLAKRGHQVDVVSTYPLKKPFPNYTDIVIPAGMPQLVNNLSYNKIQRIEKISFAYFTATEAGNNLCENILIHREIQKLIKNPPQNPPYDLLLTQINGATCFMAFGHHLKIPVIAVSTSVLYPWVNDYIGNPENLAFVPNAVIQNLGEMTFWARVHNVVNTFYNKLCFNYYSSLQSEIVKKHFGPDTPDIREIEQDIALIFVNSHISLHGIKPSTPALIEVGGLHIQDDDTEIPPEHKKWLDESKHGFVYFTFGSMVTIESFPKHILEIFYKSLSNIAPIRVLMKVPNPHLLPPGLPKNIRTFVWIPQLKVLKHKNIRAFITHGGLMGTQEAISCAVPMIGMPLSCDQFENINRCVELKIAVRLDYNEITEVKLNSALNEILHNPDYKVAMKKISERFLDRPMSPMDTACYWVEYIIRHGKKALRSPALDFSWWQIALLDVYFILIITYILVIFILISLIQFLINIISPNSLHISHSKKLN